MNSPSRFLDDIPESLVEQNSYREAEQKLFKSLLDKSAKSRKKNKTKTALKGGEKVRHNEFGEGVVVSVVGDVIVVAFKKAGIKRLSAEFAKLKKL
jgi:hypothetical protein